MIAKGHKPGQAVAAALRQATESAVAAGRPEKAPTKPKRRKKGK